MTNLFGKFGPSSAGATGVFHLKAILGLSQKVAGNGKYIAESIGKQSAHHGKCTSKKCIRRTTLQDKGDWTQTQTEQTYLGEGS